MDKANKNIKVPSLILKRNYNLRSGEEIRRQLF
jgi:hypothetical protein